MNTQPKNLKARKGQQGNVLFLILIAVALFAALSYAVTQSTRSGGGDASSEKSLVSSAALTQYPASLKTSILRMTVSSGVDIANLNFIKPSETKFGTLVKPADEVSGTNYYEKSRNAVFHPDGGGSTYTSPPKDVAPNNTVGWIFNANNEVKNIGTSVASGTAASASTADLIAFLPGVTKGICDKIHDQLGMTKTYPTLAAQLTNMDSVAASGANVGILKTAGIVITSAVLDGQPQGCFSDGASTPVYTYYHVLIER